MMNDLSEAAVETISANFWPESETFAPLKKYSGAKFSTSMPQALIMTQKQRAQSSFLQ